MSVLADKAEARSRGGALFLVNGPCLSVGVGFDAHTLVEVVEPLEGGSRSC